jgi:hypothetical protein
MVSYYLNQTVDAVQTTKKKFVDGTVHNASLAGALNKFVDTQTEYTKAAINNFESVGMSIAGYTWGKTQEAAKNTAEWTKKYTPKS